MTVEPQGFDIGRPLRRLFVIPLRHPIPDMLTRPRPPLRQLHESVYETDRLAAKSLEYHRNRTTEEIVQSLQPGALQPLIVKPDGTIIQGNTRVKVLEERGYPINDLPREPSE
jgi:hypothetical protein